MERDWQMNDFFMPGCCPNGRFFATMRLTLSALPFASYMMFLYGTFMATLCAPHFALCAMLCPLRYALCARSCPLPFALCFCALPFALCSLRFALCAMPSALCPLHFALALCPLRFALCALPFALCPLPFALYALPFALCPLRYALCSLPSALCLLRFALCALLFALYAPCIDGAGILLDFTRLSDNISGSDIFPPEKIPESLMAATGRSSTVSRLNRLPTCVP
jgi:hypothetical protein